MEVDLYGALIIEATRLGHRLFRNNVGLAKYVDDKGQRWTVPYGIGGKGGADLIGWTITGPPGALIPCAVFTALEVKTPDELTRKKENKAQRERRQQQEKFLEAVRASGGIAGIVQSVADYHQLIGHIE